MKPNIAQSTTGNLLALLLMMLPTTAYTQDDSEQWISLFNGSDLSNWIPKFTGHELGVNLSSTTRVFLTTSCSSNTDSLAPRFATVRTGPSATMA